jgi:hypothetical protein
VIFFWGRWFWDIVFACLLLGVHKFQMAFRIGRLLPGRKGHFLLGENRVGAEYLHA